MREFVFSVLAWGLLGVAAAAFAQVPAARPYDGTQAGLDAFRLAEEQRQAALATQLATNAQMRAWTGLPLARGTTILYGYPPVAPVVGPIVGPVVAPAAAPIVMDLDFAYGVAYGRYLPSPRLAVFEPWPVIPGDIYGIVVTPAVRQPVGQWQGQTGPRRWESHPVYDPPLPDYRPLPEVETPLLDKTPYATPRSGPREY